MRRILLSILTILLIILVYFTFTKGISIGSFKILSWNELVKNNNDLDKNIEDLEILSSVLYPQEQSKLNDSYKQLTLRKDEYADLVLYSSENELEKATQTEIYETEFLWTKLGNYATKNNGIDMKIDVVKGSSGQPNQYNLNFTLVGEYIYISDFISAVENDSKLGFKIDNFLLVPKVENSSNNNDNNNNNTSNEQTEEKVNTNLLQATFTVENVGINIKTNDTVKPQNTNIDDTNTTKKENTSTDSTNTVKNDNTTAKNTQNATT